MPRYHIRPIDKSDREVIIDLLTGRWGAKEVVSRGVLYDASTLPGFAAVVGDKLAGLITYDIRDDQCQIVTLDSVIEGIGIGSALIDKAADTARSRGCRRLWLITTNDNTPAIRFYQKRGFRIVAVHPNALEQSRRLKPVIPFAGLDDIPIRDEIEFEIPL
jgi:GNAT superfamily N-acetyltransferase